MGRAETSELIGTLVSVEVEDAGAAGADDLTICAAVDDGGMWTGERRFGEGSSTAAITRRLEGGPEEDLYGESLVGVTSAAPSRGLMLKRNGDALELE